VIGQLRVPPEANEITAALTLLKGLPLDGAVITGDAVFCQRAICRAIRDGGGDYLFTVKANQPALMADLVVAFGDAFPPGTERSVARASAARRPGRPAAGP
jgi:predicted transposase YbfD/YdcC